MLRAFRPQRSGPRVHSGPKGGQRKDGYFRLMNYYIVHPVCVYIIIYIYIIIIIVIIITIIIITIIITIIIIILIIIILILIMIYRENI